MDYSGSSSLGGGVSVSCPSGEIPVSIKFEGGVGNWYYGFEVSIPITQKTGFFNKKQHTEYVKGWCEVHQMVLEELYDEIGKALKSSPPIPTPESIEKSRLKQIEDYKNGRGPSWGYFPQGYDPF